MSKHNIDTGKVSRKFKTNHNGLCIIGGVEFKEDEIKELTNEQIDNTFVQYALKIGMLIEV
jgi:hypothetical protein